MAHRTAAPGDPHVEDVLSIAALMTRDPVTVDLGSPIEVCASTLHARGFRHLPVVSRSGSLEGIIADFDVFLRGSMLGGAWVPHDPQDLWLLAHQVMNPVHVQVGPAEPVTGVLHRLLRTYQDAAVIVDDVRRPIGIFTEHDGVRLGARTLTDVEGRAAVAERALVTVDVREEGHIARERMIANRIRHLVVVDGTRLYGVLSVRDVALDGDIHPAVTTRDLVGPGEVHFAIGGVTLAEAARVMATQKIGCLPVVDAQQRPLFAITRTDILRAVARVLEGRLAHSPGGAPSRPST